METIIVGGDARLAWLARLLKQRGEAVGTVLRELEPGVPVLAAEALQSTKRAIVNCPPTTNGAPLTFAELLDQLPRDARVYACGPRHPALDPRVIDLFADEALLAENAALTAEGAIAAAMNASQTALSELRCMVIGWGRIGRSLTEKLVALGAAVTVASRGESKRNRAAERGAEAVPTEAVSLALPGHGLVFNTAPNLMLDGNVLEHADGDALLIDLASPPYGIDLAAAWSRGLRAWREPALPGRYCPKSAARAILRAIDRREGGREA